MDEEENNYLTESMMIGRDWKSEAGLGYMESELDTEEERDRDILGY